jgi:hypothetical protein
MDPLTAAMLVMGDVLAASAWPLLRAVRVSPLVVLRETHESLDRHSKGRRA